MILVFNKTDVQDAEFAKEWMTDFEAFQAALRAEEEEGSFGGAEGGGGPSGVGGGSGYMGSLLNSMSLVLEEFYRHLSVVGVSSMTGKGIDEFFEAVELKRGEFERDYRPELERRLKERKDEKAGKKQKELGKLLKDMNVGGNAGGNSRSAAGLRSAKAAQEKQRGTLSDLDDDDDDDEDEGDMTDSDDDDDEDEEEGEDDTNEDPKARGLTDRYQQALADEGRQSSSGKPTSSTDDHSFARYLNAAGMNH